MMVQEKMNSRERIRAAFAHQKAHHVPLDLAVTGLTGILNGDAGSVGYHLRQV